METCILSIVAACIFLAGLVCAVVAYVLWQRVRGFILTAEQVEGTVIELVECRGRRVGSTYAPVIEFTDRLGQQREYRSGTGTSWHRFSVGDKVQMLYEQNDPDSTKINHWLDLYLWTGFCLLEAVGAFLVATLLLVTA